LSSLSVTGSATAGSFIPSSATIPSNGIYLPAANSVAVATNGTGRLFMDASGNIGVAAAASTWSLGNTLEVGGTKPVALWNPGDGFNALSNIYYNSAYKFKTTGGYGLYYQQNTGSGAHIFATTTATGSADGTATFSEALRITSGGLVGIGTTSPAQELHVQASSGSGNIRIGGSAGLEINFDTAALTTSQIKSLYSTTSAGAQLKLVSGFLTFHTGTSNLEKARLDADGRLLVGTTTANTKFVFGGTTLTDAEVSVYTTNTNGGNSTSFSFWRNYSNGSLIPYRACYITNHNHDDSESAANRQSLGFFTKNGTAAPAERMTIGSTGDVSIVTGNLIIGTAGKGIDFSATANSSGTMTSELLNDYEEGTFTPVIAGETTAGTATYIRQAGVYTKIGREVFYSIDIVYSLGTGTGFLKITGLPFTSSSTSMIKTGSIITDNITLTASNYPIVTLSVNATQILVQQLPVGGGASTQVTYDAAGQIIVMGRYFV